MRLFISVCLVLLSLALATTALGLFIIGVPELGFGVFTVAVGAAYVGVKSARTA